MNNLVIRNEQEYDYRRVEEITREAFWNLYIPGCDEHYLVHIMRESADFIAELAFVAEQNGKLAGSIFFTKSYVVDRQGTRHDTVTFGPVSVLPQLHNRGIGTALINHAKNIAARQGHKAIFIYGYPGYYKRLGFRHAKEFDICNPEGKYPLAHMALELYEGALDGIAGTAYESDLFNVDEKEAAAYDALFEPKERKVLPSQKLFEETASQYL